MLNQSIVLLLHTVGGGAPAPAARATGGAAGSPAGARRRGRCWLRRRTHAASGVPAHLQHSLPWGGCPAVLDFKTLPGLIHAHLAEWLLHDPRLNRLADQVIEMGLGEPPPPGVAPAAIEAAARHALDVARRRLAAAEGNHVTAGGDAAEVDSAFETFDPPIRRAASAGCCRAAAPHSSC